MNAEDRGLCEQLDFAALLRWLREQRMLSVSALARKAGVAGSTVSMLEKRRRKPTWESLRRLATALELDAMEGTMFRLKAGGAMHGDVNPERFLAGVPADASRREKAFLRSIILLTVTPWTCPTVHGRSLRSEAPPGPPVAAAESSTSQERVWAQVAMVTARPTDELPTFENSHARRMGPDR